ncbi:MAG: ankyrin repeat domain-containing protein [Holosporales bacterium]|nr:ankyrin repeat domain-containing protein [Holosporales bacterium]
MKRFYKTMALVSLLGISNFSCETFHGAEAEHMADQALFFSAPDVRKAEFFAALQDGKEIISFVGTIFDDGSTPLHDAAFYAYTEVIKVLIDAGANKNAIDPNGMTPLHYATFFGDAKTIRVLIDAGADKNARDTNGMTPLHHVAAGRHTEAVRVLIDAGADKNARDQNGRTPCDIAAEYGYEDIVRILQPNANTRQM